MNQTTIANNAASTAKARAVACGRRLCEQVADCDSAARSIDFAKLNASVFQFFVELQFSTLRARQFEVREEFGSSPHIALGFDPLRKLIKKVRVGSQRNRGHSETLPMKCYPSRRRNQMRPILEALRASDPVLVEVSARAATVAGKAQAFKRLGVT
jgi:hypothetical protein